MNRRTLLAGAASLMAAQQSTASSFAQAPREAVAQQPNVTIGLTAEDAQSIAQEAYIYFYPLVIMDVSRKHFTNIEPDKMFARGPMNTFSHARTFPPATFRAAPHPNFDTLYSTGWLDLTKEPVVISVQTRGAATTCCS